MSDKLNKLAAQRPSGVSPILRDPRFNRLSLSTPDVSLIPESQPTDTKMKNKEYEAQIAEYQKEIVQYEQRVQELTNAIGQWNKSWNEIIEVCSNLMKECEKQKEHNKILQTQINEIKAQMIQNLNTAD